MHAALEPGRRTTDAARTVADNVRAELARKRWSGRAAAEALGWSGTYIKRRLGAIQSFDVDDLIALAELLDVEPGVFFDGIREPQPVRAPGGRHFLPASDRARRTWLPDLDSNQEPAGYCPDRDLGLRIAA